MFWDLFNIWNFTKSEAEHNILLGGILGGAVRRNMHYSGIRPILSHIGKFRQILMNGFRVSLTIVGMHFYLVYAVDNIKIRSLYTH